MAYDPTIPSLDNYISDDITKIRENFAELADSRIVDHNLDVVDPPNGYYVRWENGIQICWHFSSTEYTTSFEQVGAGYRSNRHDFNFPASFLTPPDVSDSSLRVADGRSLWQGPSAGAGQNTPTKSMYSCRLYSFENDGRGRPGYIAVGRWK